MDIVVKMARFQIIQNVLYVKYTLREFNYSKKKGHDQEPKTRPVFDYYQNTYVLHYVRNTSKYVKVSGVAKTLWPDASASCLILKKIYRVIYR